MQNHCVMLSISVTVPCVFRGKQFLQGRFLRDVIADHRGETGELPIWRKSICYTSLTHSGSAGCLKTEKMMTTIHEKDIRERYRAGTTPYEACLAYLMEHYGWSRELAHGYLVQSSLQDEFEDED